MLGISRVVAQILQNFGKELLFICIVRQGDVSTLEVDTKYATKHNNHVMRLLALTCIRNAIT